MASLFGDNREFLYVFIVSLGGDFSSEQFRQAREKGIDITDEISIRRGQVPNESSTYRAGEGVRVYEIQDAGVDMWFGLDVQGTQILAAIVNAQNVETAFDILANVEFARGVFAQP